MDTFVLPITRLGIIVAAFWVWIANIMHLNNGGKWDAEAFFLASFVMLMGIIGLVMGRKRFEAPQSIVVIFFFILLVGGLIVRIFWL
jgi:FtsH-binding integral membrane protein